MRLLGQVHRKRGLVGAPAHAVVAGAERAADDDRHLRHLGGGHRGDELGAVLGDAAGLVFPPDHEAGDVLQEDQRDLALAAQLDEMRAFQRALREQDAVVGDDADGNAVDVREAGDERRAVARLELVEAGAIDDAGDHLADVVGGVQVGRHDAREFVGIVGWGLRRLQCDVVRTLAVQMRDRTSRQRQRMRVIAR